MEDNQQRFNKFKVTLREINTGETKEFMLQINQELNVVKALASRLFNTDIYTVVNVVIVKSIVHIPIEPVCPN